MPSRGFYRSKEKKLLFGVAGGMGEYFDVNPVLVRAVFIFLSLLTVVSVVPIYFLLALMTPVGDAGSSGMELDQENKGVDRALIAVGVVFGLMVLFGLFILVSWCLF